MGGRASLRGFAAALAVAPVVVAAQVPAPVANPGFEQGEAGKPPTGWFGSVAPAAAAETIAYQASADTENPREGQLSARLERVGNSGEGPSFGVVAQSLDAVPYRGRRIRFTAAVRVSPRQVGQTGLWLRVDRQGGRQGFFDNMSDRPITGTTWADYTIEGDVAADAVGISLGLLLLGNGPAWLDDVRFEDLGPAAPRAMDLDPTYLDQALALLKATHINSASADWPAIEARARAKAGGATQPSDVHDAIRDVIAELGEKHSFLLPPSPQQQGAGAPAEPAMPGHELIDGRFGLLRLPGFSGTAEQGTRYSAALRDGLTGMDASSRVCGWIVDLRGNTGGNMWPMLNGLDPLLGAGPFGTFRTPSGELAYWRRAEGGIAPGNDLADRAPSFALRAAGAPVAVLLGPNTASSGEMTAIAFVGRERARSFGAPTAGFSTANIAVPLSDGAVLGVTTSHARDRTGHEYAGSMAPDEAVGAPEAEAAAIRWLEAQDYC